MAKSAYSPKYKLNFKAIAGVAVLLLIVLGGGVAAFLATHNTDSRSQASADHVARISLGMRAEPADGRGVTSQEIGVDISQLSKGTTVLNFDTTLMVGPKGAVLGVTTLESEGLLLPSRMPSRCNSDKDCKIKGQVCYRPPAPTCVQGRPCSKVPVSYCVPKVTSTPTPPPRPTFVPRVTPTFPPRPTSVPTPTPSVTSEVLATSNDRLVTVAGINAFREMSSLKASVETTDQDGVYLIHLEGTVNSNNSAAQAAFMRNQPLVVIRMNERPIGYSQVFVKSSSIWGLLPNLKTPVDLTKLAVPTAYPSDSKVTPRVSVLPTKSGPSVYPSVIRVVTPTPATPSTYPSISHSGIELYSVAAEGYPIYKVFPTNAGETQTITIALWKETNSESVKQYAQAKVEGIVDPAYLNVQGSTQQYLEQCPVPSVGSRPCVSITFQVVTKQPGQTNFFFRATDENGKQLTNNYLVDIYQMAQVSTAPNN